MSRTYRLRRLPKLRAKKFVDAGISPYSQRNYAAAKKEMLRDHPDFDVSQNRWRIRTFVYAYLDKDFIPVASKTHHPWVGWGLITTRKVWYRSQGNRKIRRPLKNLMNRWAFKGDDFEDRLPNRNDGWDKWDLW